MHPEGCNRGRVKSSRGRLDVVDDRPQWVVLVDLDERMGSPAGIGEGRLGGRRGGLGYPMMPVLKGDLSRLALQEEARLGLFDKPERVDRLLAADPEPANRSLAGVEVAVVCSRPADVIQDVPDGFISAPVGLGG